MLSHPLEAVSPFGFPAARECKKASPQLPGEESTALSRSDEKGGKSLSFKSHISIIDRNALQIGLTNISFTPYSSVWKI